MTARLKRPPERNTLSTNCEQCEHILRMPFLYNLPFVRHIIFLCILLCTRPENVYILKAVAHFHHYLAGGCDEGWF